MTTNLSPGSTESRPTERATMNGKPVFSVPAKSVINFDSKFKEKLLCDGPTFSAGTACAYSCAFCYVPDMFRKQTPWLQKHGVEGRHEDIVVRREGAAQLMLEQLTDGLGFDKFKEPSDTRVIYASPAVDVAANMDLVRETAEMCKLILTLTHWQIRLLSKSNLLPKLAQLLQEWWLQRDNPLTWPHGHPRDRIIYGVSTGTLDDGLAAAFEEGTPRVSKRIESLRWLQDNGYRTFGMICPSLPQHDYDQFAREMAAAIRWERCEHVWAEVINCRGESFTRTHEALKESGFSIEAMQFKDVSVNPMAWERYARATFAAHVNIYKGSGKLRFLQYVTKGTRDFWEKQAEHGAVVL